MIEKIAAGIGMLIALYLVLSNRSTDTIISSIGGNTTNLVKTLQGR